MVALMRRSTPPKRALVMRWSASTARGESEMLNVVTCRGMLPSFLLLLLYPSLSRTRNNQLVLDNNLSRLSVDNCYLFVYNAL